MTSGTSNLTDDKRAAYSQRIFNLLFGYDYFLAHRSVDGKKYASTLYDALTGKGNELDCFLDVKHYGAGGSLSRMQARALQKTSRLIVVVTPHAHDAKATYLPDEVSEFKRMHPDGIIVPIGTLQTLSRVEYPDSPLLPLLPSYPDAICILESPEQMASEEPSPLTVAKLLNDFSEERRGTKRLRWIRRVAWLLLALLLAAIGFGIYANHETNEAIKREALVHFHTAEGDYARGNSFEALEELSHALQLRADMPGPLAMASELVSRRWWPICSKDLQLDTADSSSFSRAMDQALWDEDSGCVFLGRADDDSDDKTPLWWLINYKTGEVQSRQADDLHTAALAKLPLPLHDSILTSLFWNKAQTVYFGQVEDTSWIVCSQMPASANATTSGDSEAKTAQDNWQLAAADEKWAIGYNEETNQLQAAHTKISKDGELSVEVADASVKDGNLVLENSRERDVETMSKDDEARVLGFAHHGDTVVVATTEKLWLVKPDKEDEDQALPIPSVERMDNSPDGRYTAIVLQNSNNLYGERNFRVAVIDLDSVHSYKWLDVPDDYSVSEQVPIRNAFFGYTGQWESQGFLTLRFIGDKEFVVVSGAEVLRFNIWDHRAWDFPSLKEDDDADDGDRLPDEVLQSRLASNAPGSIFKNSRAVLFCDGGLVPLSQQFPIADLAWTPDKRFLITAAYYKHYGDEVRVWDGSTGSLVMGAFIGRHLSLTQNDILTVKGPFGGNDEYRNYEREIYVPQRASPWFLSLIDKIIGQSPAPAGIDLWTWIKQLWESPESPSDSAWKERLIGTTEEPDLPCLTGETMSRSELLKKLDALDNNPPDQTKPK